MSGQYADIIKSPIDRKHELQQQMRKAHLYSEIYRDLMAILKLVLPSEKVLDVGNHVKSILFNMIEIQSGKRPDKF